MPRYRIVYDGNLAAFAGPSYIDPALRIAYACFRLYKRLKSSIFQKGDTKGYAAHSTTTAFKIDKFSWKEVQVGKKPPQVVPKTGGFT